jgi:hypothetical protein
MLHHLFCLTLLRPVVALAAEDNGPKPPPWHLIDIWWDIGQDTAFESCSIDATISDDVPSTANLYMAPIGIAQLSGTKFYGGIQTQADGYTKQDQHLRKIGPGFLMSMWGQRSPDAIRLVYQDRHLSNWWIFIGDFDNAMRHRVGLTEAAGRHRQLP